MSEESEVFDLVLLFLDNTPNTTGSDVITLMYSLVLNEFPLCKMFMFHHSL